MKFHTDKVYTAMDWVYFEDYDWLGRCRMRARWWPNGRCEIQRNIRLHEVMTCPPPEWTDYWVDIASPRRAANIVLRLLDNWDDLSVETQRATAALLRQRYADYKIIRCEEVEVE